MKNFILFCIFAFMPLCMMSQEKAQISQLVEKASQGDCKSQVKLMYSYYKNKNYQDAVSWATIIIESEKCGNEEKCKSYELLGICAFNGQGMEESATKAFDYWSTGTTIGSHSCALQLATVCEEDERYRNYAKAWYWYVKAADLGDKKIRKFVAEQYENPQATIISYNDNGTVKFRKKEYPIKEPDLEKALYYYELYFSTGTSRITNGIWTHSVEPQSKYKVAKWYFSVDSGIQQNYDKAVSLFQDIIEVQTNRERFFLYDGEEWLSEDQLGELYWYMSVCYRFGRGVTKNALKALNYTKRAADLGNDEAINLLNQKK